MMNKNIYCLVVFMFAGSAIWAQLANKKVQAFLGTERLTELSQTENGKLQLKYLTFVVDSSYYIMDDAAGNLSGKDYTKFSDITVITSKYTGQKGSSTWTSVHDFNPLLYDFGTTRYFSLGNNSYLVIRDQEDINKRLYGYTSK